MINENSINSINDVNNTSNLVVTLPLRGTLKYYKHDLFGQRKWNCLIILIIVIMEVDIVIDIDIVIFLIKRKLRLSS